MTSISSTLKRLLLNLRKFKTQVAVAAEEKYYVVLISVTIVFKKGLLMVTGTCNLFVIVCCTAKMCTFQSIFFFKFLDLIYL